MKIRMHVVVLASMSLFGGAMAGPESFDFSQLLKLKETARAPQDLKTSGSITLRGQFFKNVRTSGSTNLSSTYIEGNLRTSGKLRLDEVLIDGSVRTSGSFSATKTSIGGDLRSSGKVAFEDVKINGLAKLSGKLNATSSGFSDIRTSGRVHLVGCDVSGELSAANTRVTLENSSLGSVVMRKGSDHGQEGFIGSFLNWLEWFFGLFGDSSKPQVILKGSTVVLGDVIFEEEGTLVLEDEARVQGKIQGAKVKKRQN